ncbi:MAG: hypothetical protein E7633_05105 [Ruminococcaceae bacterium]|nr:hypothetical protein [Oscillospiraceae bacterium]
MKFNVKPKNVFFGLLVILIAGAAVWWMLNNSIDHIEDTNGGDDYSLCTISDENIINRDIGSKGLTESYDSISGTTTYSSKKYTGVDEIYGINISATRFEITVHHAQVDSGNFKIVLLVDDEIVHTFNLNELTQTYVMENVSGYVSLRIAGESAEFMFDYYVE